MNTTASTTPYQTPKSDVSVDHATGTQPVKIFNHKGRIGRLRYFTYQFGIGIIFSLIMGLAGALTIGFPQMFIVGIIGIGYLVYAIAYSLLTIQRAHDLDKSGWWALLILIPIAGYLYLTFAPGSPSANLFGNPTPPNSKTSVVLVYILGLIFFGMLAAVAIPFFQNA